MDADLNHAKEALKNCNFKSGLYQETISELESRVEGLELIQENQDVIISEKEIAISEYSDALKKSERKAKLFKVGSIVGFALVPVALIYGMLNPAF